MSLLFIVGRSEYHSCLLREVRMSLLFIVGRSECH